MTKRWLLGSLMAAAVAMAVCLATTSERVQAQGKGNSAAAQACKHGGWRTLATPDGQPFKNQGDCAHYAAQGGTPVPSEFANACLNLFLGQLETNGTTQTCSVSPGEGSRDATDYLSKICYETGGAALVVDIGQISCTF